VGNDREVAKEACIHEGFRQLSIDVLLVEESAGDCRQRAGWVPQHGRTVLNNRNRGLPPKIRLESTSIA
jgi:hypothetical protein